MNQPDGIRVPRMIAAALLLWASLAAVSHGQTTAEHSVLAETALTGQLSKRSDGAQHAYYLIDDTSATEYRIAAASGFDLDSLVGRTVQIQGRIHRHPTRQQAFVSAQAITPVKPPNSAAGDIVLASGSRTMTRLSDVIDIEGDVSGGVVQAAAQQATVAGAGSILPIPQNIFGLPAPCGGCKQPNCASCGYPGYSWARAEFLWWWPQGMELPPLVTTSPAGTPRASAGVLGQPGTRILAGGGEVLDDARIGGRLWLGSWLGPGKRVGIEGDFFYLDQDSFSFRASSDAAGDPILARPFFNLNPRDGAGTTLPAQQDSELVAFPTLAAGSVGVDVVSKIYSGGARLRWNACCQSPALAGWLNSSRVDFLFGYRHMQMNERLVISESLTTLDGTNQTFQITDRFSTRNNFHGGEVGVVWEMQWSRFTVDAFSRVAIGNNRQNVAISGDTVITQTGLPSQSFSGGLLAQRTNIGIVSRDELTVIPELGFNLGYFATANLRFTAGYNFLYWSRVVRPGEQIDLELNPDLFPPEAVPFTGPNRPMLAVRDVDFWLQGVQFGVDYRW